MVSCMILYHSTITSLTKIQILRSIFHEEDFEIEIMDHRTAIIYLWNVKKMDIWQAVALLESTYIQLGYGFGDYKKEARKNAENVLQKWRGTG